jgi:Condensation domain
MMRGQVATMRPSLAQERLLLQDQRDPQSPVHNLCWAHRLRGYLDTAALSRSVQRLVRRHEALRTSFRNVAGQPVLLASEEGSGFLELDRPCPADAHEIRAVVNALATKAFDISREPLVRFVVVPIGTDDHLLVIVAHELVFDAWSIGVVYDELADHYGAEVQGLHLVEQAPALQPSDLDRSRRELFSAGHLDVSISYWKRRLEGAPRSELAIVREVSATEPWRCRRVPDQIDAITTRAIEVFCRDMQASMLTVLLATWSTVLHRYGAGSDLVVGARVSVRGDATARETIGQLSNTVAIRCDLGGDPTMRDLVGRIRDDSLRDEPHYFAPSEAVAEASCLSRTQGSNEMCKYMLVLIDTPTTSFILPGIEVQPLPVEFGFTPCELTLGVVPRAGVLDLTLEYAAGLYPDAIAIQLLADAASLLRAIGNDPDVRLSTIVRGRRDQGDR